MMSMTSGPETYMIQNQLTVSTMSTESASANSSLMGASLLPSRSPIIFFQDLEEAAIRTTQKRTRYSFLETSEEIGDEDGADEYGQPVEKKRRLSIQQVKALEKNFELENKLDPERKLQLARELGLQPRQIAVWFQNRRARWKTKQLEKDYDILKANYDLLKADLNSLLQEKEMLKSQVMDLNQKLHQEDDIMVKFNSRRIQLVDSLKNPENSLKLERDFEAARKKATPFELKAGETCMNSTSDIKMPLEVKEGSSSSDSDNSEIFDVDSPKKNGNEKTYLPMNHQTCSEILALGGLDTGLLHLGSEGAYGRMHYPSLYQRGAVKLEDKLSTDENCNTFLSIEDQSGAFSCWDWS